MSIDNDIILRQKCLRGTLLQYEFYFASKCTGTHSVRLTPIKAEFLHSYLKLQQEYVNHTYMSMNRVNYQNTQPLMQENDQYTDKLVKSDENKTGVYVGHKRLLSNRQLDQLNSTSDEGLCNQHANKSNHTYLKIEEVAEYFARSSQQASSPKNFIDKTNTSNGRLSNSSTSGSTSLHNGSDHDYESIESSNETIYESIPDDTALDTTKKARSLLTSIKATFIQCYRTR